MKYGFHVWLLAIAALLFGAGVLSEAEEIILLSLVVGGASILTYVVALRSQLGSKEISSSVEERLQALERRLGITEGELDVANDQLRALRAERDFDRALATGRGSGGDSGSLLGHP